MPDAVAVDIAKKVVAHLSAQSFSVAISPERSYADWHLELDENDDLRVDVVAVTTEQTVGMAARGKSRFDVPVDIAIRKRFDTDYKSETTGRIDLAEIDALMLLTQEIYEALFATRLADSLASIWRETKIVVAPDREALRTMSQFTGIVRITFEAHKDLA